MRRATDLNPEFYDAHYLQACLAALQGIEDEAVKAVKIAINGDPRYFARCEQDPCFNDVRPPLAKLLSEIKEQQCRTASQSLARLRADAFQITDRNILGRVSEYSMTSDD
jgi:hypothetical protein